MENVAAIPVWQLPVGSPPEIHLSGIGIHGAGESRQSYRMHKIWCIHWYDYHGRLEIGDWQGTICPGGISLVPPGTMLVHHWQQRNSRHYFAHFSVPRKGKILREVPAWNGPHSDWDASHLKRAAESASTDPTRANSALWELLWRMADQQKQQATKVSPARKFQEYIQHHLSNAISLEAVANAFGYSGNHANRLFKSTTGTTICDYWRSQRAHAAKFLLQNTSMGVKQVALECGYQDLQQFNKFMRERTGRSPRSLRAKTGHP